MNTPFSRKTTSCPTPEIHSSIGARAHQTRLDAQAFMKRKKVMKKHLQQHAMYTLASTYFSSEKVESVVMQLLHSKFKSSSDSAPLTIEVNTLSKSLYGAKMLPDRLFNAQLPLSDVGTLFAKQVLMPRIKETLLTLGATSIDKDTFRICRQDFYRHPNLS